jgi:hypothetical protein
MLSLEVVNGTTPVLFNGPSAQADGCTQNAIGLGTYHVSFPVIASNYDTDGDGDCGCGSLYTGGPNATPEEQISLSGIVSDNCIQMSSGVISQKLQDGETLNTVYWFSGPVGLNMEKPSVNIK